MRGARGIAWSIVIASILIVSSYRSGLAASDASLPGAPAALSEQEVASILGNLNMPKAKVLAIRPSPVAGLWEVGVENSGRRFVIYIDSSKRYVTPGPLIDYATRKDITRERTDELNQDRRIDISGLSLDNALVVGKGTAPIKVVVFTDPG